jgi:hypothetical protein
MDFLQPWSLNLELYNTPRDNHTCKRADSFLVQIAASTAKVVRRALQPKS